MTESNNPYRAPNVPSKATEPTVVGKQLNWLILVAALWIVFLFLWLPAITFSRRNPPGTYLWMKVITTGISVGAGIVLASIPKRSWLLVTVPAIMFLVFVQYTAWMRFP